jgi:hypothetical protein
MMSTRISNYFFVQNCVSVFLNAFDRISILNTFLCFMQILVFNSNPELVMVGCRVHVGNTSASHIPSQFRIFKDL